MAFAAISNVQVMGKTPTQAILSYTAPDSGACTVEVSESATFQPLVHDVDPALFPNSNRDDRPGNIAQDQQRIFVIGARRTERTPVGLLYSRALQTNTAHYFRIRCGNDTATDSFRTANIPLGSTHIDALETDLAAPGKYLQPSANTLLQPTIVDPKTGMLIYNVNTLGWAYGGSTPESGASFTAAEDASGNWSNPGAALTADGAYASYSGNRRDWLWLRNPPFPYNSTFPSSSLSFQNILLKGYCSGPDCSSGGQTVEVCITRYGVDEDGAHCEAPIREVDLTGGDATIALCGDGAPCRNPATPGDLLTLDSLPAGDSRTGKGYVYNTSADYTKLFFTNAADCRRVRPDDTLTIYNSPSATAQYPAVKSLDCSADAPQATLKSALAVDFNGTTGIPFYYGTGVTGNPRYGILVRKKSATAQSTINLEWIGWRAATAVNVTFGNGSGGFNRVCAKKADGNGFYHCHAGNGLIAGLRTEADGTLTVRYLGMAYVFIQSVGVLKSGLEFYGASLNDFLWDDNDANVMYFSTQSGYPGSPSVLVKATYTGNDVACGEKASACPAANIYGSETARWPQLPAKFQVLTPCLRNCTSADDDYTLQAQFTRYTASKDIAYDRGSFPNCGLESVQGNSVVVSCRNYQQDSFAWLFALDLGNGLPIGNGYAGRFGNTQQAIGADPMFARAASRWCTLHTYQSIRAEGIATPEFQNEKDYPFRVTQNGPLKVCTKAGVGNCDPCPPVTVNGVNYAGKNYCSTLTTASAWNAAWGTAPGAWQAGEPVSERSNLHWLQPFAPGDTLAVDGEVIQIVQKKGPAEYIVERGVGPDQTYQFPREHANGSVLTAYCLQGGAHWFYQQDGDASNPATYFPTAYVNHAFGRDGVRVHPDYGVSLAPFDPAKMQDSSYQTSIALPTLFSGKLSAPYGNAIEKHPSYSQEAAPPEDQRWFLDGHPYLFTGNASNGTMSAVPIEGDLYQYRYTGAIDPKHYDLAAFSGGSPLTDISGPQSVLTGQASDAYRVCYAWRGGECTAGSQPGNVYVNIPALDRTVPWCKEGEFYGGWRDVCVANFNVLGAGYAQWGLPDADGRPLKNFERGRLLTRIFEGYRGSATTNVKASPDGKWMLFRSNLIGKLPPYPATDEYDRSKFIPMVLSVTAPPDTGVDNVLVVFGYDALNLYCTSRREACISTTVGPPANGFDGDNPFWFVNSDMASKGGAWNGSGVPCSTTCSVAIPALPERILYYRVIYRDASNNILRGGPIQVTSVP